MARDKFVGHGPHGQRGKKEDEFIGENINVIFQTKRPRENKTIHEVSAGNAVLPAVFLRSGIERMYGTTTTLRR